MIIAVVTGASSGLGREAAKQISERYDNVEEIWLIARRQQKLCETAENIGVKSRVIPCDLTNESDIAEYKSLLEREKPEVYILVNSAGFGKFGSTVSIPLTELNDMIELNIKATVNMTLLTLPYMKRNSKIINMSSVSAFTPLPYFNIYAATKAFILRFSRALSNELEDSGITVTAVCPFWVDTGFIDVAKDVPQPEAVTNFRYIRQPFPIINKALDDADSGKEISLYCTIEYLCRILSKISGDGIQMAIWNIFKDYSQLKASIPVFMIRLLFSAVFLIC